MDLYTPPDIGLSSNVTDYDYDLDGRVELVTKPNGDTIDPDYNALGQLDTFTFDRGVIDYDYSATTGKVSTITDADGGTLDFTFDGDLPLSATYIGDFTASVERTYNNDFQVVTQSINGGDTITLDYDDDGLLTTAGDAVLTYDPANGFLKTSTVNGLTTTYTYNSYGELASQTSTYGSSTLASVAYTRDDIGRITTKSETIASSINNWTYAYDTAGRLDTFSQNGVEYFDYSYDDNSNRTAVEYDSTTITSGTYDDEDRMITYGANSYAYSNNGDLQTKTTGTDTTTYSYDTLGNLVRVDMPNGDVLEYTIDALNRRVGKSLNGSLVTGYVYDDQLRIVAELDSTGIIVSRFVYASRANIPDYFENGGVTYAIVADQLGSPRLIINTSDGSVVAEMVYDDFGNEISNTNPGFIPFGFAGGLSDQDTGLIRFGARDYDPVTGRWTNKDPIGFNGGDANLYSYVFQDPVNLVDLDGKDIWIEDASTNEVPLHQSINVGDPNGVYKSFSFGATDLIIIGEVYVDRSQGGEIFAYKKTTALEDAKFLQILEREVGNVGIYGVSDICRSYSQNRFAMAPGEFASPPSRLNSSNTKNEIGFINSIFRVISTLQVGTSR